ncbi:hypothetical protein BJY01DRAFT_248371 [Aspergillus pseudoustus]|uniref:MACPF domain-containing protein n=1 Tax=Aspergillus pseudoustus TaxID=1810923 RepID=A0ABR4JV23_9EURO
MYQKYKQFFEEWGTYVVHLCEFGARYQLKLDSHMTNTSSKKDFESYISAEYNDICSDKGSAGLRTTDEYKKYLNIRRFDVNVTGGDPRKNADLSSEPHKPEKVDTLGKSISDTMAHPLGLKVMSLGDICERIQGFGQ